MSVDTAPSPYPRPVAELLPRARTLVDELGEIPSRNRLMRDLRIGAPKADELRSALLTEQVRRIEERTGDEPAPDPWDLAELAEPEPILSGREPDVDEREEHPMVGPVEPLPAAGRDLAEPRVSEPDAGTPAGSEPATADESSPLASRDGHPDRPLAPRRIRPVSPWPVIVIAIPAMVAIWSGWVGLGGLTGFGMVNLLPGIAPADGWATINSAITLPIGVEAYAAYALRVWLSGRVPDRARRMARWSAILSLLVGAAGQVAYHVLVANGVTAAPWQITTLVACLPVAVLGMGAALAHLLRGGEPTS